MLYWLWGKNPGGRKLMISNCKLPSSFNYVVLAVGQYLGRRKLELKLIRITKAEIVDSEAGLLVMRCACCTTHILFIKIFVLAFSKEVT
jgi:hypothetical protein